MCEKMKKEKSQLEVDDSTTFTAIQTTDQDETQGKSKPGRRREEEESATTSKEIRARPYSLRSHADSRRSSFSSPSGSLSCMSLPDGAAKDHSV
ncbi:hypothetical protein TNIN_31481 [Trichonephila inaurata madagascariensis]|uniref:Uncharacterized protein n=1 Tax=Trichonephila inaurata madagascariensis TaxID=2747483 RepID=A0A8X7CE61_9ARAC|nr:hypothetical protein TNIN_31481 [Trichonephila inaurata madagascariensis]